MKFLKSLVLVSSFLVADITTYISDVNNGIFVDNINDVEIGSSGILIREYDNKHSSIYFKILSNY